MQFHIPSVVQAVPAAIALPVPVVPVLAGLAAGAAELAATGLEATTGLAAAEDATTGAAVAGVCVPAEEATVAKTPPETAGADDAAGAEVATEAAEVAPVPDPPVVAAAPATVLPHDDPVGATGVAVDPPSSSRESPGAGNLRSVESTVPQPLPMFAVNISGSALKAVWSRSMS